MRLTIKAITIICAFSGAPFAFSAQSGEDGAHREGSDPLIDMDQPVVATVGEVEFRECILEAEGRDRTLQCAWIEVPEDYSLPEPSSGSASGDANTIKLFIARRPARKPKAPLDPMLFLAGGPGQSASESYLHMDRVFSDLAKERDFYLIDQRGTGHSNFLGCGDAVDSDALLLSEQSPEQTRAMATACLEQLPGDPRFYTTSVAIRDFERIRKALGKQHWNLFGASYGTRVALHYMRRHPEAVRTATLDSVVPPSLALGPDIAFLSQRVLDDMYQRCEEDGECRARFPQLRRDVEALFARLEEGPIEVEAESFRTGQQKTLTFTRTHLEALVRMYLYNTRSLALLPPMLHEAAANGNFAPIARAATASAEAMEDMLAPGMHNAVLCTEDAPFYDKDSAREERNRNTYMGIEFLANIRHICELWPRGVMDEDFKEPLNSDVPTLLLSGERDPITPPEYAEQVAESLSRGRHLELEGQGHFVSVEGCAPQLIETFVSTASPEGLPTACLDRLDAAPLFINFNGPTP